MKIEVLGSGCSKCQETEKRVREALAKAGLQAEVAHVYDLKAIAQRGVVFTPAVAVDGVVKIAGRVPAVDDLVKVLSEAAARA